MQFSTQHSAKTMTMYKCENDCYFWGKYNQLEIVRDIDQHPYGDSTAEEETIELYCPECHSDELTEWLEAV